MMLNLFLLTAVPTPPIVPSTEGFRSDDTALIIGIVAGLGAGLLAVILCGGALVICGLCWRKKKNYRKYVLPYRAYMDGELSLTMEGERN